MLSKSLGYGWGIYIVAGAEPVRVMEGRAALVARNVDVGPPVRVTYLLTEAGHLYVAPLQALQEVASVAS